MNRREAIAAMATVAAIGTVPAVALARGVDRSAWNAAFAAYERVEADAERAHQHWNRTAATYEAITGISAFDRQAPMDGDVARLSGFAQSNHTIDDWGERICEAVDKLLQTPAPDTEALLWKLNYLFFSEARDGDSGTPAWSSDFVAQTIADADRLLTVGRA